MRIETLWLPAVLSLPLAAGCSSHPPPASIPQPTGVTWQNLNWMETADQDNRVVVYQEVLERLGPGRTIEIESFDALPLREDWPRQPDITWRIWEDESGDFILGGFDEDDWLFRATGKVSEIPPWASRNTP